MARGGSRLRSICFRVADSRATADHLRTQGVRVVPGDLDAWIAVHPDDNYGVLWQFTEAPLAADPRG